MLTDSAGSGGGFGNNATAQTALARAKLVLANKNMLYSTQSSADDLKKLVTRPGKIENPGAGVLAAIFGKSPGRPDAINHTVKALRERVGDWSSQNAGGQIADDLRDTLPSILRGIKTRGTRALDLNRMSSKDLLR